MCLTCGETVSVLSYARNAMTFLVHLILRMQVRLFDFVEDVCLMAAAAVLTVVHGSHEDTGTAFG